MASFRIRNIIMEMSMEERSLVPLPPCATRLPVYHIFGCLSTGEKGCLHVHGALPYLVLRVGGSFSQIIARSIENRVNEILHKDLQKDTGGPAVDTRRARGYIARIEPLRGRSMYGYHEEEEEFVRVYFASPFYASRAAQALAASECSQLQPFEAHLTPSLQFAIDHSVFGMDYISVQSAKIRIAAGRSGEEVLFDGITVADVAADTSLLSPFEPQTCSHVEADLIASDILNAQLHSKNVYSSNPGLEYIWAEETARNGGPVPDTFSKCCEEKRPSSVIYEAEREHFKRLRRIVRALREERVGGGEGAGTTQAFNDTVNESRVGNESAVLEAWSERSIKERSREVVDAAGPSTQSILGPLVAPERHSKEREKDDETRGTNEMDMDLREFDLASTTRSGSDIKEEEDELDAFGDENEGEEDEEEANLMEQTFVEIERRVKSEEKDAVQQDEEAANGFLIDDVIDMDFSEEDDIVDEHEEEAQGEQEEGQDYIGDSARPATQDGSRAERGRFGTIGWLTRRKCLPFVDPLNCRMEEEFEDEEGVTLVEEDNGSRTKSSRTRTEEARSFYNMFDTTSHEAERTVITSARTQEHEEGEVMGEMRHLSVLSLELATLTTGLAPDPQMDPIIVASLCAHSDICVRSRSDSHAVFIVGDSLPPGYEAPQQASTGTGSQEKPEKEQAVVALPTEDDLVEAVLKFAKRCDADILVGYDNERLSWGYLMWRARALGRAPISVMSRMAPRPEATAPAGRLMLSVWRMVRKELALRSYDRSSAAWNVLKRRQAEFPPRILTRFYQDETQRSRLLLCNHLLRQSRLNVELLVEMDLFTKTAELARVYGIQFEEVLTRGSQFRVESMLLRLARRLRLFAPTVTPAQRNKMCAPEQLQLVMEPQSGVYFDPVIVLDFQSLYPSMAIAYNYCYSTCLGKVAHLPSLLEDAEEREGEIELGALQYRVPVPSLIRLTAQKQVHVSPLGATYAIWSAREGIVPLMLREILAARIMVKQAAKKVKSKRLARVLDARQIALKLVANVTYGYTAANWSGRMPCVEVADAILGKGRETLERAIDMVNRRGARYKNARVIYGDTDSMFVLVKGASLKQAFEVGRRIADDVTEDNPAPVVLKLEKVYKGCVLQTKKRYAGLAYEADDQEEGRFDAKGIETVRRDTCPVVAKILEQTLRLLFSQKFARLQKYLDQELANIDALPYTDFLFCKEYRGEYSPLAHVPQAKIADQLRSVCIQAAPLVGERVPYVVVEGPPTATVYSCVRSVEEFLAQPKEPIHYSYYVNAHILAALHRVLSLIPTRAVWIPYPRPMCATPYCGSSCVSAFCAECSSSSRSLHLSLLHSARLTDRLHQCRLACAACVRTKSPSLGECRSLSCPNHSLIVTIERDPTRRALTKHPLFEIPRRL